MLKKLINRLFLVAYQKSTKDSDLLYFRKFGQILLALTKILRKPKFSKTLLIIKPDGVGDFFIIYKYLLALKQHPRFCALDFHLVTSNITKPFAQELLKTSITKISVVERWYYYRRWELCKQKGWYSLLFAFKTACDLRFYRYCTILYPVFTHESYVEFLIDILKPKQKFVFNDQEVIPNKFSGSSKTDFFEPVKMANAFRKYLSIDLGANKIRTFLDEKTKTILVALGASVNYRRWNPKSYAQFLNFFRRSFYFNIIVVASEQEFELYEEFKQAYNIPDEVVLHPPQKVADLLEIVKKATLLLGNDSAMVHLAAVNNVPFICFASGNHVYRFTPYPADIAPDSVTIFPKDIRAMIENDEEELFDLSDKLFEKDVNEITVEEAIMLSTKLINKVFS